MKFMLAAYEADEDILNRRGDGTDRDGEYWQRWKTFGRAMARAGVIREMHGLRENEAACTLRLRAGRPEVEPGAAFNAFHLGGYFIIDVADAEAAVEWAAQCPAATLGIVEIRPLLVVPDA